jgi:hypothetical protein
MQGKKIALREARVYIPLSGGVCYQVVASDLNSLAAANPPRFLEIARPPSFVDLIMPLHFKSPDRANLCKPSQPLMSYPGGD